MSAFARSEGVASTTLHPWIAARGFDTSSRRKDSNQTTASGFSRVELVGQAVVQQSGGIRIATAAGCVIEFKGGVIDPVMLRTVLEVVSAC